MHYCVHWCYFAFAINISAYLRLFNVEVYFYVHIMVVGFAKNPRYFIFYLRSIQKINHYTKFFLKNFHFHSLFFFFTKTKISGEQKTFKTDIYFTRKKNDTTKPFFPYRKVVVKNSILFKSKRFSEQIRLFLVNYFFN